MEIIVKTYNHIERYAADVSVNTFELALFVFWFLNSGVEQVYLKKQLLYWAKTTSLITKNHITDRRMQVMSK